MAPREAKARVPMEDMALIDFGALLAILRRNLWLIAAIAGLTMALSLALAAVWPRTYTGTATILVDPRQQRVTTTESVLPGFGSDAAAVESQVDVITSTAMLTRVIDRLELRKDPDFSRVSLIDSLGDRVASLTGSPRVTPAAGLDEAGRRALGRLQRIIEVRRRGLTYVIEVNVQSNDRDRAALIANALTNAYLDDLKAVRTGATQRASDLLKDRLDDLARRVRDAERKVEDFKARNNIVSFASGDTLIERQVVELNSQLFAARAATAAARAKFEQVRAVAGQAVEQGALPEALQNTVIASLRAQYALLLQRQSEAVTVLGRRHPNVAAIDVQVASARREIEAEVQRVLTSLRNEFDVARRREQSLEESLATLKREEQRLKQAIVQLRELEREAQASRALYEQFLARAKETSEQVGLELVEARLIAPAIAPLRPTSPNVPLILALGLVGGLTGGVGAAFLRQQVSGSRRSPARMEAETGLPVVASVPVAPRARRDGTTGFRDLVVRRPDTAFADAIRAIRFDIQSAQVSGGVVVLVTSPRGDEGKTTIAANLAEQMARNGKRTLLIDGDLRSSALSRAVAPKAAQGLVDVVVGRARLDDVIVQMNKGPLSFLPMASSGASGAGADALMRAEFVSFIRLARARFEAIVIDGPPLLPVVEARVIAREADTVLCVVDGKTTETPDIRSAVRTIDQAGDARIGLVVNRVPASEFELYAGQALA